MSLFKWFVVGFVWGYVGTHILGLSIWALLLIEVLFIVVLHIGIIGYAVRRARMAMESKIAVQPVFLRLPRSVS